ncbi:unnamed protein product [Trichogramma brassicae]|uniref:N-acetyltransferase domain-containing protein n=1 Tax=Trichogramma brassicae TaxID=86971 RepID=A0A6H5I105_9HYME|nr:unnamed protein product [Trichogramma brassicae]
MSRGDWTEEYEMREAQTDDIPSILTFVKNNFDWRETMLRFARPSLVDPTQMNEARFHQMDLDLTNFVEVMVRCHSCQLFIHKASSEIVLFNARIVHQGPTLQEFLEDDSCTSTKLTTDLPELRDPLFKAYFQFTRDTIKNAKIFQSFPRLDRAIEFVAVVVHLQHRRKGLAFYSIRESIRYSQKNNCGVMFGLFTTKYAKRSAENAGLVEIHQVENILDYKDETGEKVFENLPPDSDIAIMAITVDHACDKHNIY